MGMRKARCGWCGKMRRYETLHSSKKDATRSYPCAVCLQRGVVEDFILTLFQAIAQFARAQGAS